MILDIPKFVKQEQPYWRELAHQLDQLENDATLRLNMEQVVHLHYLYQRASADLAKIMTYTVEPTGRQYLEALVARAYGELHAVPDTAHRLRPGSWFLHTLPQTFRRHLGAFWLAVAITLVGALFGGTALLVDPTAKAVLMPFEHLLGDPSERVRLEEQREQDRLKGTKATFSAWLMTHNIKVSIFVFALGMTWGLGTILVLFYNGIILGAVIADYVRAGESVFLAGWLLPHGSIEIPAILLAGQAGIVLASALLGRGYARPLAARLRSIMTDLVTLIGGVALLLVWAGFVEAFLSQYHQPVLPYALKIALGLLELLLLVLFLALAGRRPEVSHATR